MALVISATSGSPPQLGAATGSATMANIGFTSPSLLWAILAASYSTISGAPSTITYAGETAAAPFFVAVG